MFHRRVAESNAEFTPGRHIVLVSQLNKNGDTKGSTALPHLVDIEFVIQKEEEQEQGHFIIRVGGKHRCGRTGPKFYSEWEHLEDRAMCVSIQRLSDEFWCKSMDKKSVTYYLDLVKKEGETDDEAADRITNRFADNWLGKWFKDFAGG